MKVIFDFLKQQVALEGDGPDLISVLEKVREIAPQLSKIEIVTSPEGQTRQHGKEGHKGKDELGDHGAIPAERDFAKKISPNSATERIATIAAYVKRYRGQDIFGPKEMNEWFTHFGFPKPTQMPVALFDAKKNLGYVENIGYGKWKLSVAGENFITRKIGGAI